MQIATTKPCLQASQESDSDSVGSDSKSDHDDTDIEDESYCDGRNNIDLSSKGSGVFKVQTRGDQSA